MAGSTTNYGLTKPLGTESYNVADSNNNADKVDVALTDATKFPTAGGTGTALTIALPSILAYRAGLSFSFVASSANSGAATTINLNSLGAKNLYKPNTTSAPSLVAGKAYTVWYNGTNFFLQASAEGTATAAQVLAGYTFSSDSDTGISGTMVDRGSVGTQDIYFNLDEYTIASGYHNGSGKVRANIANLDHTNVKYGVSVGGVAGSFTSDGDITPSTVLSGKIGYAAGSKVVGTIASKGAQTYTPGTTNQTIAAGQYLSGNQTIAGDADLVVGNIKVGVNIFGVTGTYTNDANAVASEILSGKTAYVNGTKITGNIASKGTQVYIPGTTNQVITAGQYLSGDQTITGDSDLISTNIRAGVNIFGVVGNANVVNTSSGTATAAQILSGRVAWVDGAEITGNMPNNGALGTYTPTTTAQSIPAGYTTGGTVAGDADLVPGNIKEGVVIFGVTGGLAASGITFKYGLPPL